MLCPAASSDRVFVLHCTRVQKWNVVAVWSWNLVTDTCAICRNNLHEPSIEYQASQGIIDDLDHAGLSIAWGMLPLQTSSTVSDAETHNLMHIF